MNRRRKLCNLLVFVLMSILAISGCGVKNKSDDKNANGTGGDSGKTSVWVPEYVSLSGEGIGYGGMRVDKDTLYFVEEFSDEETGEDRQGIAAISLSDNSREWAIVPADWKKDAESGMSRKCETFFRTAEGGFVTLEGVYPEGAEAADENASPAEYYLCRYDADGQKQEERDLTGQMAAEGRDGLLWKAAMDGEGRFYFAMHNGSVRLVDAEGNYCGEIAAGGADNWIPDISAGKNGKVYIAQYGEGGKSGAYVIRELDFEKKEVGAVCRNYPGNFSKVGMAPGAEQELLVYDATSLYEYEVKGQNAVKLLDWMDGNVDGIDVICVHAMQDGRIFVIQREQGGGDIEMTFLSPKKAAEVVEKETVTIACYEKRPFMEKIAAKFNKQSDRYHVEFKIYFGNPGGSTSQLADAFADADLRFNADLVSDHSPDLLLLEEYHFNAEKLAENGLFEDLKPWLDQSDRYSYEDYFPQTLEACTYNGTLVSVPKYFSLSFFAGKAANLGTKPGWTAEEMIAFGNAHPDAWLLDHVTRRDFLDVMCTYSQSSYVDWASGECHYDGEGFIALLELANRFRKDQEDNRVEEDEDAAPYKLQDGRVLLDRVFYSNYYKIQETAATFGGEEICCIGYPNGEGNSGIYLRTWDNIAMLANASHKEGAWAFLEYYLGYEEENATLAFFANKKAFEERTKEVLSGERYLTDGSGKKKETDGWWNWEYDLHTPTREEVDQMLGLLEYAVPSRGHDSAIRNIVLEEAEAYFQGQKSAQAVAKVIQNRVQVYVNENL